ncbi:DUF1616 domain-containing protein [Halobium salinum]|uniref:DUF1616 domain-containing protein n=1 Tax=Halobium salinum TaxID=1364940 RepID=A0ABD5PA78_9EURY|nr:DUF1616 domain-containing protein [Halobium salinum]
MSQNSLDSPNAGAQTDKTLSVDLLVGVLLVLVADAAVVLAAPLPLRLAVGIPALLVVPGYAIVSFLFPRRLPTGFERAEHPSAGLGVSSDTSGGTRYSERLLLSVGCSVVAVPVVLLLLLHAGVRLDETVVMGVVTGVSLPLALLAVSRRRNVAAGERFDPSFGGWVAAARRAMPASGSTFQSATRVVLGLTVLVAAASVGYAMSGQPQTADEPYTELYLLSENESGELVAGGYPTNLTAGQQETLHVGVDNHEGTQQQYTVVAELERVTVDGERTRVTEQEQLGTFQRRVPAGGTLQEAFAVEPTMTGDQLRLTFHLYKGDAPADPTVDNAYRSVHLWVSVDEGGA